MSSEILVDIAMGTYNHEGFIAQALESVLSQETDFPYRIIICDDFSTDNTRSIIMSYVEQYPGKIITVFPDKHFGLMHRDRPYPKVLKQCTAKYIAMLEGDDYWTDPNKLQKQVDLLERNPEIAGCFSNAIIVDDDGNMVSDDYFDYFKVKVKPEIRTADIVPFGISPCNTLLFRRAILINPPDWFARNIRHSGFDLLITLHGILYCINEKLGAYRIHAGGVWSLSKLSFRLMTDLLFLKPMCRDIYMHDHYGSVIREVIRQTIFRLLECKSQEEGSGKIAANLVKFIFAYPRCISFFILIPFWIFRYYEIKLRCSAIIGIKKIISGDR